MVNGELVRFVCPLPSAFMTKMSVCDWNAIRVPSADHVGAAANAFAPCLVRRVRSVPSSLIE